MKNKPGKSNAARAHDELFFSRPEWSLEELRQESLPLYWNRTWLEGQLKVHGTSAEVARIHGYPRAEVKRFALHFGLNPRQLVAKFFLIDRDLLEKVDRIRGRQPRSRFIVEALQRYFDEVRR